MSLTIELTPEMEKRLRLAAAQEGRAPEDFARSVLEERLTAPQAKQVERNRQAIALMDEWLKTERTVEGDREWEELKAGLEANRRATGERVLFDA